MRNGVSRFMATMAVAAVVLAGVADTRAQMPGGGSFNFEIYKTNDVLYPFVQVYFRSFDQNMDPVELNYANIGLMVQGKIYDPQKANLQTKQSQYYIQKLQNREAEGIRTVVIWDCSKTMAGPPFDDARRAIQTFIQTKRSNDQIAILAIRDRKEGYQIVSDFTKDVGALFNRMNDVQCDGQQSHIYDTIAAGIQMCSVASEGGNSTEEADFAVLNTLLIVSDGKDEGSSLTRAELTNQLARMNPPVPVYSLAYSKLPDGATHVKNLQNISKQTLGRFWDIQETREFTSTVELIHRINRSDYVVTFRAYAPVDGNPHNFKIGVTYPSGTGKFLWKDGSFQAIDATPAISTSPRLSGIFAQFNQSHPLLPDGWPYMGAPAGPAIQMTPSTPIPTGDIQPVVQTPAPPPSPDDSKKSDDSGRSLLLLGLMGMGGLMAIVIIVLLIKLKSSGPGGSGGGRGPGTTSGMGTRTQSDH